VGYGQRDGVDRSRAMVSALLAQGDVWLMQTPNDKSRPVLVVTRDAAIAVLNNVVIAPVTSTVRSIPTCIALGADKGIDRDSVASFDNLAAVPRSVLTVKLGALDQSRRHEICAALRAMADC
jgi:mRNA interferase MazF